MKAGWKSLLCGIRAEVANRRFDDPEDGFRPAGEGDESEAA